MDAKSILHHLDNIPRDNYASREEYFRLWYLLPKSGSWSSDGGKFQHFTAKVVNECVVYVMTEAHKIRKRHKSRLLHVLVPRYKYTCNQ